MIIDAASSTATEKRYKADPKRPGVRDILRSRLCWQTSLAVFIIILIVQAAVLWPFYVSYEQSLLRRLTESALAYTAATYRMIAHGSTRDLRVAGRIMVSSGRVKGGIIFKRTGTRLTAFGEELKHGLTEFQASTVSGFRTDGGDRYEVLWRAEDTNLPFLFVARLDASSIGKELTGLVWSMVGLIVLFAIVASAVTNYVVGRLVLHPLLTVRRNLLAAERDPANADQLVLTQPKSRELADMEWALKKVLQRVAESGREGLRRSERRFRDFAGAASDFFWECDAALRVTYVSERFFDICGHDASRVVGQPLAQMFENGAPDAAPDTDRLLDHLQNRRPFRRITQLFHRDGSKAVQFSISGIPTFSRSGEFVGFRGTGSDITEQWRARNELEVARDEAEASSRAKSEFLANMSHELRTPLNGIMGFSEIIADAEAGQALDQNFRQYAKNINQSAQHLLSIINDILDLSKIEFGTTVLDEREVDLERLLVGCLRIVEVNARAADVSTTLVPLAGVPVVWADGLRLKQAVLNLIANAVKFTPAGGTVTCGGHVDKRGIHIAVADTGIGIAQEDIDRAMRPFEQVDGSLNRRFEGTGLGLALAKSFVELHGGTVAIDSLLGQGTTVTITLPADRRVENCRPAKIQA